MLYFLPSKFINQTNIKTNSALGGNNGLSKLEIVYLEDNNKTQLKS